MVSVLHLLSYVGGLAGFLFVTLSLGMFILFSYEARNEEADLQHPGYYGLLSLLRSIRDMPKR
jgi:hypothetical protein